MTEGIDKRQSPRRPLNERVFAYVDGARVDVESSNVSRGGLFVKTRRAEEIPLGARLVLVFHSPDALRHKIFLVAQVRRHQTAPVMGVGLSWEKAITPGSAQALATFLNKILDIRVEVIEAKIVPETGGSRHVYFFDPEPPGSERAADDPIRVVVGGPTTPAPTDAMPQWTPPPPPPDAEDVAPGEEDNEPLTEQVHMDRLLAPAQVQAALQVAGHLLRGVVTSLGVYSFVFETDMMVGGPFDDVSVLLTIPVRGASHEIECRCRMTTIIPKTVPGHVSLEFDFIHVDEGPTVGVLHAYVRWLHATSVASS